ncbi:innexin unc-7 family protein [Necator americanus]|uniref:Innexin n=1 Tax=Necator americanus TaxID=51031 RepID=W2TYF2_NECAM|nr:innexin unc-7 family protein [Necator americanus]ETN87100.1 innexin unc-7 family protein [Necator americanus]
MLRYVAGSEDRDFVDRLHSYFTCNILIGLAVLVSFKQFGGKPIECLVPDMFSSSWEQYAENYCWAQDTYYVPMGEAVAGLADAERRQRRISYYQWVPFFLLLEAACFRLPSLLWQYLAGHSGKLLWIKIHEVVKLSSDPNNIKPEIKRANIKSLTTHLQGALRFHRRLQKKQIRPHRFLWMFNLPYSAFFVTSMYLCTKFFYLSNVCLQLLLMNKFLETDKYAWYGLGAMVDLINGTTWEVSGVFPRVSLCDFDVRVMGNVQEHTVQCVLVINIFNEKIFIFLWFWYLMLVVFTLGSFLYWLFVAVIPYPNRRFIKRHLEISEMPFDPIESDKDVRRFIDSYLKSDGVFVIRMLTLQAGVIFGTDLVLALWKSFFGIEEQLKRSNSMPDVQKSSEDEPHFWPPPPDAFLDNEKIRMRKALGQNIDNSEITQDFLQKLITPYPERPAPRYVAAVSVPVVEDETKEALIRSLESSPVKGKTVPSAPSSNVVNRVIH